LVIKDKGAGFETISTDNLDVALLLNHINIDRFFSLSVVSGDGIVPYTEGF
jgi:hypothetical protein